MKSLYIIQTEHQAVLANIEEVISNEELTPEELTAALAQLESQLNINAAEFQEKAEAYAAVIREKESRAAFLRSEAQRLLKMARTEEAVIERLESRIMAAMQEQGMTKAETLHFKLGVRSVEAVEVADIDALGSEYTRVKIEADKTALKKALKVGMQVAGARLVTRQSLQIR